MQWRLAVALIAIALGALLPRSPDSQKPSPPFPLPAAATIGPGVGITTHYADGSGGIFCTAGFLVHASAGQPGFLTAGHCDQPGGAGEAIMRYSRTGAEETVGTFMKTVREGAVGEDHDIALVMLDAQAGIPPNSAIAGVTPATGVSGKLVVGDQLCKFGVTTGKRECGPIVNITASKVRFAAETAAGDSGGPVYTVHPDGTATAVGIHIGQFDVDYSHLGGVPKRFSVAELIQPWLDKWDLTIVRTPR